MEAKTTRQPVLIFHHWMTQLFTYLLMASVPRPKLINILGLFFTKLQNDSATAHIFACGDPGVRPDPEIRTREIFVLSASEIFVQCT